MVPWTLMIPCEWIFNEYEWNQQVYTWGKGDYYRLGHGTDQHIRWPTLVEGLRGKKVTGISVGALHCLAVTDAGQVLAWGDNDHGQQGNGSTTVNRRPTLVHGLEGVKITRIACGSSHSVAWTAPEPPSCAPPEPVPFPTAKDPLGSTAAGMLSHQLSWFFRILTYSCCRSWEFLFLKGILDDLYTIPIGFGGFFSVSSILEGSLRF